jgi:hypothetical protein
MRRMLREVLFVRDERADRCLLVLCLFFVMLFYLLLSGGPKIPKIKVSNSKVSNSKVSNSKVSNSKVSNSLLTFHRKESNCLLRDFLVSFCETLLCVERLACIFEIFGPLHIISHERRRKQTTNRGLSADLRCRVSCFPVWCDERRRAQTTNRGLSAGLRCGIAISPCGAVLRSFPQISNVSTNVNHVSSSRFFNSMSDSRAKKSEQMSFGPLHQASSTGAEYRRCEG